MSTAALKGLNRRFAGKSGRLPVAYSYSVSKRSVMYGMKRAWKQGEKPSSSRATCRAQIA